MEFVYDKQKASDRKKEIDKRLEKENKARQQQNDQNVVIGATIAIVSAILIIGIEIFLCVDTGFAKGKEDLIIITGFVATIIIEEFIGYSVYKGLRPKKFPNYPPDVRFYCATEGKRIVESRSIKTGKYHAVFADVKDNDGKIKTVRLGYFKTEESCMIKKGSEHIVDLADGTYWVPSSGKEKRK